MTLRAPSPAALSALHHAAFAGLGRGWRAAEFARLLAEPGCHLACAGPVEAPWGVGVLRIAADEAEILTLAVHPDQRRHGIGAGLLAELIAMADQAGVAAIFLEVGVGNAAARALYHTAGFVEIGRRPGYVAIPGGGREDAVVMRRQPPG